MNRGILHIHFLLISIISLAGFGCGTGNEPVQEIDLDSDGYDEIIFSGTWKEYLPTQFFSGVCIYNHSYNYGSFTDSEEWEDENFLGIPAIGTLPTVGQTIALSRRENLEEEDRSRALSSLFCL